MDFPASYVVSSLFAGSKGALLTIKVKTMNTN